MDERLLYLPSVKIGKRMLVYLYLCDLLCDSNALYVCDILCYDNRKRAPASGCTSLINM